jgi:hypothetical protein
MPLQTSSFKYPNVHHHLHMNPIIVHLDDLLLYTMCIYRGRSKGNILYKVIGNGHTLPLTNKLVIIYFLSTNI